MSRPRRASVPASEAFTNYTVDARPPLNTVVIPVKKGDIIDVGILWGDWLTANQLRIKSSSWAAAGTPAATPVSPTIVSSSSVVDEETGETAVMLNTSAATEADTYYLENTVVLVPDKAVTTLGFPDRTAIRRIHVKVAVG